MIPVTFTIDPFMVWSGTKEGSLDLRDFQAPGDIFHGSFIAQFHQLRRGFLKPFKRVKEPINHVIAESGNEEDMRMRYAPTTSKKANKIRPVYLHDFLGYNSGNAEQTVCFLLSQIMPPRHMPLGDDQAMSFGVRVDIKKTQRKAVFMNDVRRRPARDNIAENAGGILSHIKRPLPSSP